MGDLLHLAKRLQDRGADDGGATDGPHARGQWMDPDDVRELPTCSTRSRRRRGGQRPRFVNNLGTSWTDLEDASRKVTSGRRSSQSEFALEFGSDDDGDE